MWFYPRTADAPAHNGTTPAAPMPTPFHFPCGQNFLNAYFQGNAEMKDRCAPPNFDDYWWSSVGFYSPALCPKGYTAGCMRWNSKQGPPVEATETAVQCVPSGYACASNHISMAYSYSHTAPMIQVRWAESDLSRFATHPLYPGANPTNHLRDGAGVGPAHTARGLVARAGSSGYFDASDIGGSFRPTPTASTGSGSGSGGSHGDVDDGGSGGGLSTGAKIGIGVGVPFGVLALLFSGGFFIWRAYRKKRLDNNGVQQPQMQFGQYPQQYPQQPQYPAPVVYGNPGLQQMMEQGRHEMPAYGTAFPAVSSSDIQGPSLPEPAVLGKPNDGTPGLSTQSYSPAPTGSELDGRTYRTDVSTANASELHGDSQSHRVELTSESRPELDGSQGQKATSPISRKQVASPVQHVSPMSPSTSGPDTMVAVMPGIDNSAMALTSGEQTNFACQSSPEPSAEEIAALQAQHSQLEARKQRLLELEQIETEQAELQRRMGTMRGNRQN